LTIGDGLVSQVPALIISVASGLLVTKASAKEHLGQQLNRQIFHQPKTLYFTAGVLFLFSFMGMPPVPFIGSALMLVGLGYLLQKKIVEKLAPEMEETVEEEAQPPSETEQLEEVLTIDPIRIELGYGLIFLVEGGTEGDLLERVALIRKQLAMDLGMIIPMVRIRDNIQQKPNEYLIKIRGVEVGKGEILPNHYLAMNPGTVTQEMEGVETQEPAFGLPALWIPADQREVAEMNGYTVVEPAAVLATHLTEILKNSCAELLNRQEVQNLVNRIKEKNATLVDELIPSQVSYGMLQKVLQKLLSERVSIRDLETILETLGDYIGLTREVDILVEYCRQALARTICGQYMDDNGSLHVLILDAQIEKQISESIQKTVSGIRINLNPNTIQQIINVTSQELEKALQIVDQPLILTSSMVRPYFRKVIENTFPTIPVISYEEIVSGIDVKSLGTIRL